MIDGTPGDTPTAAPARDGAAPRRYRPGLPRKGWSNLDVEDMGEPSFECELCGYPEVRFVHVMTHPEYPGEFRVGCVCAGHLEEDYAAAKGRERAARNAASRRARLMGRYELCRTTWRDPARWRVTERGNFTRRAGRDRVTVFPNPRVPGEWKAVIGDRFGTVSHPSPEAAFDRVFLAMFPLRRFLDDLEHNHRRTLKLPGERGF